MRLRGHRCLSAGIFLLLTAAACSRVGTEEAEEDAFVPVDLAFSLEKAVSTRASVTALSELSNEGSFRGMQDIRIVPFGSREAVRPGDEALGPARGLPSISSSWDDAAYSGIEFHTGLIRNNNAHLFPNEYATLPKGTASVLVYGCGIPAESGNSQLSKHINGSFIESGWAGADVVPNASDFTFSPEPIYTGGIPASASTLADILTRIAASVTYTQTYYYQRNGVWYEGRIAVTWDGSVEETLLREYFLWFTGEGELMTGAGRSVETLLSMLYGRVSRYVSDDTEPYLHMAGGVYYPTVLTEGGTDTFTYATLYNGLRDTILQRFEDLVDEQVLRKGSGGAMTLADSALTIYPTDLGLPSGSAAIRWNGLRFMVVTEGMEGLAGMDSYCYMPPLCYRANTTLSTSADSHIYQQYTSRTESWDQIVGQYRLGKTVDRYTCGVALDDPLQYAVGMLVVTVRATSSLLPDNDDDPRTNCSVTGTNFPVTGIILGGQHRQDFLFSPDPSSEEYYVYDNQVSGVYLTTVESAQSRTLVFPTPEGEDESFILELRNDSGATFTGADGLIFPGNYFYLTGRLETPEDPLYPSVIMQDHFTAVRCVISSLENAHVAVPDPDNPQLLIGVQCTLNWIMAESSYVVLD